MDCEGDILLVEDDASHVKLVEEAFRRSGSRLRVTVTDSIAEARSRIAADTWDLVLADYLLDDGYGSELIPDDPESASYGLVVLTSHGDEHVAVRALTSGAVDYVVKSPDTFMALPRVCERAIQNRNLLRERQIAERALRRSEQHLRLAQLASGAAAWEFDLATGLATWSCEAAELIGLPAGEQDSGFEEYTRRVHSDDRRAVLAAWKSMIEMPAGLEPVRVEHRITLLDGSTRWVELCGRAIDAHDGPPFQLAGMLTNITARKAADEELNRKEQELAHVGRLATLGELVAGIAHELNQPLTVISNYAAAVSQSLDESDLDVARLREWNSDITLAADLAGGIIRRIRGLVDRRTGNRTRVNIFDLIDSTRAILLSEQRSRRVNLIVRGQTDDPVVEVDAIQIQQVLINLLRNAYQAVASKGDADRRVRIEVESRDESLRIAISDSGPGLQVEPPERVFESFYTTREDGLGMGLAISRSIVQAHGGRLRVESRPESGACFRFDLRQRASTSASPNMAASSAHPDTAIAAET